MTWDLWLLDSYFTMDLLCTLYCHLHSMLSNTWTSLVTRKKKILLLPKLSTFRSIRTANLFKVQDKTPNSISYVNKIVARTSQLEADKSYEPSLMRLGELRCTSPLKHVYVIIILSLGFLHVQVRHIMLISKDLSI